MKWPTPKQKNRLPGNRAERGRIASLFYIPYFNLAMFKSARLKLTMFYLLVLVAFSVLLSGGIRLLATRVIVNANQTERGTVHHLVEKDKSGHASARHQEHTFAQAQSNAKQRLRYKLNFYFVMLNLGALLVGGVISYWFAGKTLKPIAEAQRGQTRFAADASHELRTPLANLRTENEVLLRQPELEQADVRQLLASNIEEVERLQALSNGLLALSSYGHMTLTPANLHIQPIIDEALNQTSHATALRHAQVIQRVTGTTVKGDQESLVRLLVIIIDNALKYGPVGGHITIKGRRQGNMYRLTIADEGKGISKQDLPYIFDRLYRGDRARTARRQGHGLGLSLAQEIVKANQGTVSAKNTSGGGAEFAVYLPLGRSVHSGFVPRKLRRSLGKIARTPRPTAKS
jgi:signal transduction histidine kinase